MARRKVQPSPVLGTALAMIDEASETLVTRGSRFRHTFEVALDAVRPDPAQARKVFDEAEIRSLAATLAEHGQLQPVLLRKDTETRGRWILVAGERRWRAALSLGWTALLAIEHDGDPEVASLLENLQRVDLTPVEEARGIERLIQDKGWRQEEAAAALGRSEPEISAVLRILTLPEPVLDAVLTSELKLAKNALVELARIKDPATLDRLVAAARHDGLTIRAIRAAAGRRRGDATSLPASGMADPDLTRVPDMALERPPRRASLRLLGSLTAALAAEGAAGRPLRAEERDQLLRLKAAIEQRLGAG